MGAAMVSTALYKYTYTLGRSLYVPLTSRCNSIPLPSTRGPGFTLPRLVAETLVNIRNVEMPGCVVDYFRDYDIDEERVFLPPYDLPLVNSLYKQQQLQGDSSDDLKEHLRQRRQVIADRGTATVDGGDEVGETCIVTDDGLRPSISTIINEVRSRLGTSSVEYDQVVIAGEGEPTLRMDALLAISRAVTRDNSDINSSKNDKIRKHPAVRVITNGLCYGIPNLGYSPNNLNRDGTVIPVHRHAILKDMTDAGITRLSVALNTANRHEYDLLMEPSCHTGGSDNTGRRVVGGSTPQTLLRPGTAHDLVCELIVEATKIGMDVEITGIDRPGIDKIETERLARMLLSVRKGDGHQRRSAVRWRRYFD